MLTTIITILVLAVLALIAIFVIIIAVTSGDVGEGWVLLSFVYLFILGACIVGPYIPEDTSKIQRAIASFKAPELEPKELFKTDMTLGQSLGFNFYTSGRVSEIQQDPPPIYKSTSHYLLLKGVTNGKAHFFSRGMHFKQHIFSGEVSQGKSHGEEFFVLPGSKTVLAYTRVERRVYPKSFDEEWFEVKVSLEVREISDSQVSLALISEQKQISNNWARNNQEKQNN